MRGWLVNDRLTCIPGTKTFWHDLLEHIPGLIDCTGPSFPHLARVIEDRLRNDSLSPQYIIRNATYFDRINTEVPTISLLQDDLKNDTRQIHVCDTSTVVVTNSPYTAESYKHRLKRPTTLIPLGIDFDFFRPMPSAAQELQILPNSLLFVGDGGSYPKGFDKMLSLIEGTEYNFCLVMKDGYRLEHPRVRVFNKIQHDLLVKVYNSCVALLCTSVIETQHLAGLEAAACDIPIIATNVGAYYGRENGLWGLKAASVEEFKGCIEHLFAHRNWFSPRNYFLTEGFDKKVCMLKWQQLIESIVNENLQK